MKVISVTAALRRSMPKSVNGGKIDAGWVTSEVTVEVIVEDGDDPARVGFNAREMARAQVKAELAEFFTPLQAEIDGLYLGLPDQAPAETEEVF